MIFKPYFSSCLCLSLVLCKPVAVYAETADSEKPIHLTADKNCVLDQKKGTAVCDDNVVVIQGTMVLHADHVEVYRNAQKQSTMLATGKIVTFRQKLDDTPEEKNVWVEGQASRVDYSSVSHLLVLTHNARVKKGNDIVIGDVITYNTETQVYQSKGGGANTPNQGRVTVIVQPQNDKGSPSKTQTAKP